MKPFLVMLVGLPGSGKSTYAKKVESISRKDKFCFLSSDEIREELYGDESIQGDASKVFNVMHGRARQALKDGKIVLLDSTNIRAKQRKAFLDSIKNIDCYKRCQVFATPLVDCYNNNLSRERQTQEHIITRMYMQWETPHYFEGFDTISILRNYDNLQDPYKFIDMHMNFNQDNPHHALTLGGHCKKAADYIKDEYPDDMDLFYAALLHDCGKPLTKSFFNSKGEATDVAHYYRHENVGGYESMFYSNANVINVSALITHHMKPYAWERDNNEKLRLKYKKMWGDDFYNDVMKLHEADLAAH